jgi:Meiotically Up-regulated Gene 113 (MUG113) protein
MVDYIYLIASGDDRVKIGRSKRPKKRVVSVRCGSPDGATLVAQWQVGGPAEAAHTEKIIHKTLKDFRTSGEWFSLKPHAAQAICQALLRDPPAFGLASLMAEHERVGLVVKDLTMREMRCDSRWQAAEKKMCADGAGVSLRYMREIWGLIHAEDAELAVLLDEWGGGFSKDG